MRSITKFFFVAAAALTIVVGATSRATAQITPTVVEVQVNESQRISIIYGVLAGISMPMLSERNDKLSFSNGMGFQVGAMMGVKFKSIEIVPELWYSYGRNTLKSAEDGLEGRLATTSVEIPLLVSVPIGSIFRINVGPTLSLMSRSTLTDNLGDVHDYGRVRSTAGWVVGASGTLWGNIILDARFTGFFKTNSVAQSGETYSFSQQNISVNLGYRF
ncbi:MAG: outer membrane beta-barrel protein [Rikenellaceae bacterium]